MSKTSMMGLHIVVAILVIMIFALMLLPAIDECRTIEIERYSIGMEITHAEESTYYIRYTGVETTRTFYLRGDDKAIAVNVDEQTYAKFTQGDWVEVEIQTIEHCITHEIEERATIIGAMETKKNLH